MIFLLTSAVILLFLANDVTVTEATCFTSRDNLILQHHVISSLKFPHIGDCWQTCKQDPRCQSLNYFVKSLLCEINNRTIDDAPKDVIYLANTAYFDNPYRGEQ